MGKQSDSGDKTPLEQYKILFSIIVNLNDTVVKGILTIFLVYVGVIALVLRKPDDIPNIKALLYINYVLVLVFLYYLSYLRSRIRIMFELAQNIETKERFSHQIIKDFETLTRGKFLSTRGLYAVITVALLVSNTILILLL